MEDKRGKRWSGRTEEQRSFRAPALLNSSAGVQRGCVCACVWRIGSLITREKGYIHTHRKTRGQGLTFSLSSTVPSAWLTLTSEAAELITSWEEWKGLMEEGGARIGGGETRSGGKRKKAEAEAGTLTQLPSSPPHFARACEWNFKSLSLSNWSYLQHVNKHEKWHLERPLRHQPELITN